MAGAVRIERSGRVMTLLLDNAAKRNALDLPMLETLAAQGHLLSSDADIDVVMLRGAGGLGFGAGADFDSFRVDDDEQFVTAFKAMDDALEKAVAALAGLPQPIVAALDGPCIGGAVCLALAADLRIASSNLRLSIPAVSLGIVYPIEAIERLIALCGPGRTKLILMTGCTLSGQEAQQAGLVETIVPANRFEAAAAQLCAQIDEQAGSAVRGYKHIVDRLAEGTDRDLLRMLQQQINTAPETRHRIADAVMRRRARVISRQRGGNQSSAGG